jgi:hypothetical protein
MQSPQQIKSRLFSLVNKGIKYDLARMFKAAALLGDPHKSYKSIHVAGTNGKGSTCAFIESILRRAGYKTGLYTSPHITKFEERFKIDGVDINESSWFDVYKDQEKIINDLGLTFFEAATLMSFEIFKRAGVQYAIFETGMGGRLYGTYFTSIPKIPPHLRPSQTGGTRYGRLFAQLLMLKLLASNPDARDATFLNGLSALVEENAEHIMLPHIGFPDDWESVLLDASPKVAPRQKGLNSVTPPSSC